MSERELFVLLNGRSVGRISQDRHGRLALIYSEEWRRYQGAYPLSLSMPLTAFRHAHDRIEPFLWGLLPDNERVLERWGQRFQVSPRNAFGLISEVGEDCACAFQFVRPERLDALIEPGDPEVDWLSEDQVERRLGELRADHAAGRRLDDAGQFSLAGAQPKTAFYFEAGRWGIPSGRVPTTHILKPPTGEFDGFAENEHICLTLARRVGLPATRSEVRRFGSEVAIVVERYDRARTAALAAASAAKAAAWAADPDAAKAARNAAAEAARAATLSELAETQPVLRLHQEDLCQALGVHPVSKYQNQGGPSPEQIVKILESSSSRPADDVATFVNALAFNWVIGGTDAHAKNYALLHGGGGRVRLAPLYDIVSALPYRDLDFERLKLAMKIGGKYRIRDIGPHQWRKLAAALRLDPADVVERVAVLATRVAEQVEVVHDEALEDGLTHPIVERLADIVRRRADACAQRLRT